LVGLRKRGEDIRRFILENVSKHPTDIATLTAEEFSISRQAVNKHLQKLVSQSLLSAEGTTRDRRYTLRTLVDKEFTYALDGNLKEDVVWRKDVSPLFAELPENVRLILQYGLTEIVNNAIDHSSGTTVTVRILETAMTSIIQVIDDGEGIFKKIQREFNLGDERHALLELAKGKLTTDPAHHSGEGIFFSSRMFDGFMIFSGKTVFHHSESDGDWLEEIPRLSAGTAVLMSLSNNTARTWQEVFDRFASTDEDIGFTKTIVPVRLAQYEQETLISRSQAKRLLARIDRFRTVIFDFEGVDSIGQAFADEIFRVFAQEHPDITILDMNANPEIERMIKRATPYRGRAQDFNDPEK
jgi:hypothetical protein